MKSILVIIFGLLSSMTSFAMSVDWTGTYRFEFVELDRPSLTEPKLRKSYMLHHLNLNPKVIAADGINIVGRFDLLPSSAFANSQVGQQFGYGVGAGPSNSANDSSVASTNQNSTSLQVTQLYLDILQEYGEIVVGRAPLHFGLGITHNAGNGMFDHWYDLRDMLAYRFVVGNLSMMPVFSKVYDASLAQGRDVSDMIWDFEYKNPETNSEFGVLHQTRSAGFAANDAPFASYGGSAITGDWKTQDVNLYIARGFENFDIKFEAGFKSGSTGLVRTVGSGTEKIDLNGYGLALEMNYAKPDSKWKWNIKTGVASGDNPDTTNYEGFQFDKNYDIGFLLFNHPMGMYDLFTSNLQKHGTAPNTPYGKENTVDDESISNAIFIAPSATYVMNDRWEWKNTLITANLQTNPVTGIEVDKGVGIEWDTTFIYKPIDRVRWVNEVGILMPGEAFTMDGAFDKKTTFGWQSRVAVSF